MPKLLTLDDMDTTSIPGLRGYQFSAVRADHGPLGAAEYTLVTIATDISGSVSRFRLLLIEAIQQAVLACTRSPRAANIMVRVITFNTRVEEVHGFMPLSDIDVTTAYTGLTTGGGTALYDAAASAIGAMAEYGRILADQDYGVNGIVFIITDGDDRNSTYGVDMVRSQSEALVQGEVLESFRSILIGINAQQYQQELTDLQVRGGLTEYLDVGDATPANLAKMAAFVSRSVSSQAQSLGQPLLAPAIII